MISRRSLFGWLAALPAALRAPAISAAAVPVRTSATPPTIVSAAAMDDWQATLHRDFGPVEGPSA